MGPQNSFVAPGEAWICLSLLADLILPVGLSCCTAWFCSRVLVLRGGLTRAAACLCGGARFCAGTWLCAGT